MKEVITIANRKGGVGKTATTHAIGAGITLRGYKVLYIDLDSQSDLSAELGTEESPVTSMEILTGEAKAEEAIQHTESGDIIPASPRLDLSDTLVDGVGKEYRLKEALEPVAGNYDYCLIDTPPALGIITINALTASDSVLIPAKADKTSATGIGKLYKAIQAVQKYTNPELSIKGILITLYKENTILHRDYRENIEAIAGAIGTKVFEKPIREYIAIAEAQTSQKDIYSYAPRSNGAEDYTALVEEILRK